MFMKYILMDRFPIRPRPFFERSHDSHRLANLDESAGKCFIVYGPSTKTNMLY